MRERGKGDPLHSSQLMKALLIDLLFENIAIFVFSLREQGQRAPLNVLC